MNYDNSTLGAGLTTLTVNYNYDGSSQSSTAKTIAYQTTQAGATLNLSPSSYNFGVIVANNNESKTQTFTLTNTGPNNVTGITFQNITGDSSFFTVDSSGTHGCATTMPLASGDYCNFTVKFGPTSTVKDTISATLPITYSFAGGSSSTSLSLSGYSRATISANVELYNVSSSIGIGNGESANSAYQVDASSATNSTITLSYRNTGLTDASNFAINSAPTGYTIDNSSTCGSSITTLQANGANSCTVVIKPTISTAGALNVNLSSSLSGSWTDEHGSVNNQTILWNTGSGTQNTIYVNIFATPQVAAAMSSSSSGTPAITQVSIGQTFYIALTLTGGYNVNTTYTISAPAGFTPSTSNCSVTSNNPQCYVAITAPTTASTGNTINITANGGVAPTPTSFTFNVVAPTMYAYMSTDATGIFQCAILESGGLDNNSCVKKANPNTAPNYTVSLALDPTGKYLYALSNTGSLPTDAGNYYACNLLSNGGIYESTNCGQKAFPSYGNLTFAPTQGTMYAYLAGQATGSNGNKPNYCTINQESSLFCNVSSSYPTSTSRTLSSAVVNGGSYVYISSINDSTIFSCDVTNSAGYTGSNCPNAAPAARKMQVSAISTIAIGNISYAYVIDNSGGSTLKACQIESSGVRKGLFANNGNNDCPNANENNYYNGSLDASTRIAAATVADKPYLYIFGNVAGEINICPLSTNPADAGAIIGYEDPVQGNYCAQFSLGSSPYITTTVGSMVFGSF
ncbi:MAG: hypothetical protein EKK54_00370 [Neisseriaceae bacterium]|nr:MAG: hypothetical protein EKK54_00370 [Neisseriaceae bacterium]